MRHLDIVRHRVRGAHGTVYLCILQSDFAGGADRVVAPVARGHMPDPLAPPVEIEGRPYCIRLRAMTAVPRSIAGATIASAEPWRADITRGLDLLLFGV